MRLRGWRRAEDASERVARRRPARSVVILGAALAAALAVATGCSGATFAAPTTPVPATMTLLTATAPFGTYLTDDAGRALYMWDADRAGASTCYGDCAVEWPPLTVGDAAQAGPDVDASLIGSVARRDGTQQVTYGGWPLYYFEKDVRPGELSGQGDTGFGAVWWVVSPSGEPVPSS